MREDPDLWEDLVRREISLSETDAIAREVIKSMYWESDRDAAFRRFLEGLEFAHIRRLLADFGVSTKDRICELGGGSGYLAWAMSRVGFASVALVEPNPHYITGTGYLRSREDSAKIRVWNDLGAFYSSSEDYEVMISRNCVHHFQNIALTAACIHEKLGPGGLWLMFREWYADDPAELRTLIRTHPYCQKYGVYEWPFPAHLYVQATVLAGFRLIGIIPAGYANGCLGAYVNDEGPAGVRLLTRFLELVLRRLPAVTVGAFQIEKAANEYLGLRMRRFTRPQLMVFRRAEVSP